MSRLKAEEIKIFSTEELQKLLTNTRYGFLKDVREKAKLSTDQIWRLQHGLWVSYGAYMRINDYFNK